MKSKNKLYITLGIFILILLNTVMRNNAYAFNPFNKVITFYNYKDCRSGVVRIVNVTYTQFTADIEVYVDCPGRLPYQYEGANYSIDHGTIPVKSTNFLDEIKPIIKVYSVNENKKKEYYKPRLY